MIFAFIIIVGGVVTMIIGFSNKNKEGNPEYDTHKKAIFTNLSLYYAVSIPLGLIALVVYIFKFVVY
jgi:hypothetical protein